MRGGCCYTNPDYIAYYPYDETMGVAFYIVILMFLGLLL